jgi:RNA polymerase sigma factor (sigma-70 family)
VATVKDLAALTDHQLLKDFRDAASQEAFSQLIVRHGGMVYRVCLRILHNVQDAEDAAQATFILLAKHKKPLSWPGSSGSMAGWLYEVARCTSLGLARSRARRTCREQAAAQMNKTGPDPSTDALRDELDDALGRLPTKLRETVVLRYLEGRSQDDTAILLGCHRVTVAQRTGKALERLRSLLAGRGVTVATAMIVTLMTEEARAGMPVTSALGPKLLAAGTAPATGVAAALADQTAKGLFWSSVKAYAAAGVAAATVTVGTVLGINHAFSKPVLQPVYAIHAGGGAVGQFVADRSFSGGELYSTTAPIDTAGVENAAPAELYQTERWGKAFGYTLDNLTPGAKYVLRLHFAEIYWSTPNTRVFNVKINGAQVLSNFDMIALAGKNKAIVRDFPATADAAGKIVLEFTTVLVDGKISGIEVFQVQ